MIDIDSIDLSALPWLPLTKKQKLPRCSAVYFAIGSNGSVQYVGKAVNLCTRWATHHRKHQLGKDDGAKIAYLECPVDMLNAVESAMISRFQPLLNGARVEVLAPNAKRVINISRFWPLSPDGKPRTTHSVYMELARTPLELKSYTLERARQGALTGGEIKTINKLIALCSHWAGREVRFEEITEENNP